MAPHHQASPVISRRAFAAGLAAAGAVAAAPAFARARRLAGETIVGENEYTYRVQHQFPQLPDRFTWQTTHGVALDAAGNLYVIHEGQREKKDHPAIFVFDPKGAFIRAFGSQFQGGGHGIEVRREGNAEFLYVCGYQQVKSFAKLTLDGTYKETIPGFGLPANVDTLGRLMLVPELKACVTLLDDKNQVVARLGRAVERLDGVKNLRGRPDEWRDGQFVHPHDACFAPNGDILVAEWVATGRVTKLTKV